jgi:hypothetical protein
MVVPGEYLKHVHMRITEVITRGNKQMKFVQRQKTQDEKKKIKEQKKKIKHAKLRPREEEEKPHEEENKGNEEETRGWADDLWLRVSEALGNEYNPSIELYQQVWVIDEGHDGSPIVYQGNAMRTKPSWTEDGVVEWELEFRGEKNRTRYPLWSIFTMRKDALAVLKLLSKPTD